MQDFRKSLIKQGYEGLLIRRADIQDRTTDLYCIFSEESLIITEVFPVVN